MICKRCEYNIQKHVLERGCPICKDQKLAQQYLKALIGNKDAKK